MALVCTAQYDKADSEWVGRGRKSEEGSVPTQEK